MHLLRNGSQVTSRPARKATAGTPGYFSESNEVGKPSYPGQDWFNDVIDEFNNALVAVGITYEPDRLDHLARMVSGSNFCWLAMPIGHSFALELHIPGVATPPVDSPAFRYIKLSSSDAYNGGILINEIVTGTAPVLSVTAEINFPNSPMHGQRVELRNTSNVFSRAGENGGIVVGDTIRNIEGRLVASNEPLFDDESDIIAATGALYVENTVTRNVAGTSPGEGTETLVFDASRSVPTSNQNQPVHIEEPYFMRIF